ncbi:tripartite tricarboxylate transporter substrate binding protein [Candidimonas nitroreducens]|uniref:ABC transporter substrate-binding protein n=1 Tax=Candidimonas nitroreducens TaxID=683354 RepID=A0A225MZC1_9BURK|nr:tripartite tricarboxylate transporter substrate binding protein [Candidimonas nitroreducens]OWT66422.1 ABC transporter substrate-binding protein [Candidimonas nitroreducens]
MRQDKNSSAAPRRADARRRTVLKAALLPALGPVARAARAQGSNLLKIVAPYEPGGSADIIARGVSKWLTEQTGRTVIVQNRSGAGAALGTQIVVNSPPDGNTLLMHTGTLAVEAAAGEKTAYDPRKDLAPLCMVAKGAFTLLVNPKLPVHNVRELIAYCRARPGKLNYASSGIGTSVHLSMELFKSMAGIDVVHIPYRGGAPSLNAVLAGEAELMMNPIVTAKPFAQAGRVRALAVTTNTRSSLWPELPTIDEAGVPGYNTAVWYGLSVPAATPADVMAKLSAELRAAVALPSSKTWLMSKGVEAVGDTPAEFKAKFNEEIDIWAALIKKSHLVLR